MLIDDIVAKVESYAPGADVKLLLEAYQYAALCHRGQTRKSGEDYFIHPLEVAGILADIHMDVETIATGLLHDTIEDTLASREEIEKRFGKAVADMVEGVTKLSKLNHRGKLEEQAENFRKLVLAAGKDIRVILVKIADRLHNLRTLSFHKADKQKVIAKETLDFYTPLVHRLGLEVIKVEMEDLCFRSLHPDEYARLQAMMEQGADERKAYVEKTIQILRDRMNLHNVTCDVAGRVKHLYSVHQKMLHHRKDLADIHDLLAFRLLVPDRDTCYIALGHIHAEFIPVGGRLKDYIAAPKSNGYQSLHTTVVGPEGQHIEIQIRTHEMHRIAESGIAAHWRYKNGKLAISHSELQQVARLRTFIQMAREIEDPADYLNAALGDLSATIHVFTPRQDIVLIPDKATALDFAYHVHTEVGNHAQGARINGRQVPLRTPVHNGDTIEIMTSPDAHPTRDWLDWATTHRALEKIRKKLRDHLVDQGVEMGRNILETALRKVDSSLKRVQADPEVQGRIEAAGYKTLDELALAVVAGRIAPKDAARLLVPKAEPAPAPTGFGALLQKVRRSSDNPIIVSGQTDILVDYARCCNPLKGEPIVGYITRGRGLSVHREDCSMVKGLDVERFVPVAWDDHARTLHQGMLRVVADDRPGILAEIATLCASAKINLWKADVRVNGSNEAVCDLGVAVGDINQLTHVIRKIKGLKGILSVERVG